MLKLFSSNFPFKKLLYIKGGFLKMRKNLICILLLILILSLSGCSKVSTKEMDVFSSTIEKNASETTLTITVILNRQISSQEYEDYARSIIDHCIKNNFKSVKFSYDLSGYPSSLDATIYATENDIKKNNICYTFRYHPADKNSSSKYTINDNSDKYLLEIIK